MTHEYVIALGGRVESANSTDSEPGRERATAIAWAADHVLAVGSDRTVRSISRGDSIFIDVGGCVVTALPEDVVRAEALVREQARASTPLHDVRALLEEAGLLRPEEALEVGSPADLAFWDVGTATADAGGAPRGLVATVRDGGFTEGDEHRGPFLPADSA